MAPEGQSPIVQPRAMMEIQRSLPESMVRIIWIPNCPNDREDRHRSGQVPDRRRTTIGATPRAWKTVEDVRSCFTAWMIQFASRRASWEATAILDPLSNQTESWPRDPGPRLRKRICSRPFRWLFCDYFRLSCIILHNPQYRQPAVLDFIEMRTVTIFSDPSDEMNTFPSPTSWLSILSKAPNMTVVRCTRLTADVRERTMSRSIEAEPLCPS